ncbi:uncharacterized protein PRCAT00003750001 [Priceomyces carsonii]|uniref:uncharacterized protein n=1 Tax=Priceomyces carsonii TaxID=28549 RepID=UPI002ED9F854|nr:unnamed protein product [Priceomyces carsonii]
MARSQRQLKGWQYIIELEKSSVNADAETLARRSLRGRRTIETITLKREVDDLEIKAGDTVLIQQKEMGLAEVALIKDIRFGNDNFLDVVVLWFIRMRDIEYEDLPSVEEYSDKSKLKENEIFLTSYLEEIQLDEILEKTIVLSADEFDGDMIIDGSNSSTTFMCKRGCDSVGEQFTEDFDYRKLLELFEKDSNELMEFIRSRTVPKAYNIRKSPQPKKSRTIEEQISDNGKKINPRKRMPASSGRSDDEGPEPDLSDNLEEEEQDDDSEVESENEKAPKKKRGRNKSSASKPGDASRDYINSVLSPLKKRLKVKQDLTKPSLLSLSPRKVRASSSINGDLVIDTTSEVFKEVKAKLHTSSKLTSLPCREDEFTSIYLNLETAIQENSGCCVYISGTPGVGKTATVREVISQLQDMVQHEELQEFDYLEVNGLKLLSPNVAYEILWEKISGLKVSPSNAALLLENYFSQNTPKKPLVVLMDELDQIVTKKQNVMYNFFNWPTYAHSGLIVIALANTMDLPERVLSNKISSRLGLRRIQFSGYSYEQLGIIIAHRLDLLANLNKKKVVVSSDAIGFASRKVASISGDARRALTICRRAVEIAEKEFFSSKEVVNGEESDVCHIQISHISKAINETINSPTSQFISNLPFASKLFLSAILLNMKRTGLAENSLGDIIDEMRKSLMMVTSSESNRTLDGLNMNTSLMGLLYGHGLIEEYAKLNIRVASFSYVVNELVEAGILVQQNTQSERYRLLHLNVSEKEILSVLKRDKEISTLL